MQAHIVYHVDYVKRRKTAIGEVYERREKTRSDNYLGLLKVARMFYSRHSEDAFYIVLGKRPGSKG